MWDGIAEGVGALLQLTAERGPRWMRIGCVAMLLVVCGALLTMALWVPLL